jgi:predicted porin
MRVVIGGFLAAALLAPPAFAESSPGTWNGLPDRFQIDTGYFRLSAQTVLRFNGASGINFEKDLGINQDVNTFWLDATWRVGRRHQLKLGFTRLSRESQDYELQRDFTWGGVTYPAGFKANATTGADIIGGYYRFAAFRNDRFEIGPAIGVGYLSIDAGIQATGTIGSESRSIDRSASTGSITGALGGYVRAWPAKRFVFEADFLYIKVKPGDSEASVTDWRIGADYYFHRNVGVGVQYKYDKYTYDRGILATKLGGEITYKGFQIFATFRF